MVDIKLSSDWQLTQAADGDAPICSGTDELLQRIAMEAQTQAGEVFYDPDWGWSLAEFFQAEDSDFTRLEITERIKSKLKKYAEVNIRTVQIAFANQDDKLIIEVKFRLQSGTAAELTLALDRVSVEVITVD